MNTEQLKRLENIVERLDGLYDEIHSLQGEEREAQDKSWRPEIQEANFLNFDSAMDKIGLSIAELQEAASRPATPETNQLEFSINTLKRFRLDTRALERILKNARCPTNMVCHECERALRWRKAR
jgi:hypothetical protein